MKFYWILQLKMAHRKVLDSGIHPLLAYLLLLLLLIGGGVGLFSRTHYAAPIIVLIAAWSMLSLSENRRVAFLSGIFGDRKAKSVRVVENISVSIPFAMLLLFYQQWLWCLMLIVCSVLLALSRLNTAFDVVVPTPFAKRPYEMMVGFRKALLVIIAIYTLAVIAGYNGYYHLCVFALLFLFLVCMSFYNVPEREYFVWVHAMSAQIFLLKKMSVASYGATLLALPVLVLLLLFFPNEAVNTLLFFGLGMLYLWLMVIAKYTSFPYEVSISVGVLMAMSLSFPPFAIVLIPYFFNRSVKRLNQYLA